MAVTGNRTFTVDKVTQAIILFDKHSVIQFSKHLLRLGDHS